VAYLKVNVGDCMPRDNTIYRVGKSRFTVACMEKDVQVMIITIALLIRVIRRQIIQINNTMYPARVLSSNLGLGNQEDEEINWSAGMAGFYCKGRCKVGWCVKEHLPAYMNQTAELQFISTVSVSLVFYASLYCSWEREFLHSCFLH
jgi:hypothetical protein